MQPLIYIKSYGKIKVSCYLHCSEKLKSSNKPKPVALVHKSKNIRKKNRFCNETMFFIELHYSSYIVDKPQEDSFNTMQFSYFYFVLSFLHVSSLANYFMCSLLYLLILS